MLKKHCTDLFFIDSPHSASTEFFCNIIIMFWIFYQSDVLTALIGCGVLCWCHVKLPPSQSTFCAHHATMRQFTTLFISAVMFLVFFTSQFIPILFVFSSDHLEVGSPAEKCWLTCQTLIATLAFRRFENSPPPYLSELFHTYQPSRTLRSSNEKPFKVLNTNLKSAGNRSLHFQASCNRPQLSVSPYFQQKILKHIFLKNANSLLVFHKALFLPSLTMECMCGYRGGGVNMVTDVLYSVNMYFFLCV